MQLLLALKVTPTERQLPVVQAFVQTMEYAVYVEDAQVFMVADYMSLNLC